MTKKKASLYKKDNTEKKNNFQFLTIFLRIIYILVMIIINTILFLKKYITNLIRQNSSDSNSNHSEIYMGNFKISKQSILIIFLIILVVVFIAVLTHSDDSSSDNQDMVQTTPLGNNSIGYVEKEGPYGNTSSSVKIAYILGVHPREKGAHELMLEAFNEKESNLSYCYYIYRINVTSDSSDFSQSRMNGQLLAQEFAVPDIINQSFDFVVDCHYSNGAWGVSRFVFTPVENNTQSYMLSQEMSDNFDWLTYYVPPNPSSPKYVTTPLNEGGVPAIIYEAYTEDENNVTLQHDIELIEFIDNWNFDN